MTNSIFDIYHAVVFVVGWGLCMFSARCVGCVSLQCIRGMSGRRRGRWRWGGKEDGRESRWEAPAWAPLTLDPMEVNARGVETRDARLCVCRRRDGWSCRGIIQGKGSSECEREEERPGQYGGLLGLMKRRMWPKCQVARLPNLERRLFILFLLCPPLLSFPFMDSLPHRFPFQFYTRSFSPSFPSPAPPLFITFLPSILSFFPFSSRTKKLNDQTVYVP